jgi:biotin/methionine sulfoxide reductase
MIERIPHCAHWGPFTALVEDGRVVGAEPWEGDPAPSHMLAAIPDLMDPAVRIDRPYVREGWLKARAAGKHLKADADPAGDHRRDRGSDRFVAVDWETVLGLASDEIRRVIDLHGNDAIFAGSYGWTSAGRFHHAQSQVKRFFNCLGGYTAHVDTYSVGAGAVIARHILGNDGYGDPNSIKLVAENTELLLVCGALSPRTSQVESGGAGRRMLGERLKRMKERGVRVVLVSPRRDDIPEWVGAEWWPIVPNTDTALLIALAGEIVAAGRADDDFLKRCCSGSEEYLAYLKGETDGTPKTAEWAAGITGLDAAAIRALADQMTRKRTFISISWSLQRAVHGEQPWWAGTALSAIAGQLGYAGGGVAYGLGSVTNANAHFPLAPIPGLSHGKRPNSSFIPVARIADMLLNPGGPFTYEGKSHTFPDIRLVYWAGGNPYHHHQDLGRLTAAWTKPETVIVQEIAWTATAKRADIVLPATTTLERNDISGGRRADMLFAMKKCVEPYADARSDFDIMRGLAERLGVADAFTEGRDEMGWARHLYDEVRDNINKRGGSLPDFDTFWETGRVEVPEVPLTPALSGLRADPETHALRTESGKLVLYSRTLEACAYPDCPPHPTWMEPPEWLGAAKRKTYPFHLLSAQPNGRLHSQLDWGRISQGEKQSGREAMLISPDDAKRLGLKDGDTALLRNARGRCLAGVRISSDIRPGVAILPTGAWWNPIETAEGSLCLAGNANVLTLDVPASAFSGGCAAHTCLVAIERYDGNAPLPTFSEPAMA